MMKYIRGLFALILLIGLTACGGGGGSAGNTSNGARLFTTAPDTVTVSPGATQTFTVGGGVPAYSASSSNGAAIVSLTGNTLTIKGGGGGSAIVTVKDAAGVTVTISVTIGSGLDLFTTAPDAVTVAVGGQSAEYTIGGGTQVYDVASSDNSIANVVFAGNRFIIVGVTGGKADVTVRDSIGGKVLIKVTVGSVDALFSTAGNDINVGVNAAVTYTVGGGNGPYSVGSSNTAVATANISGSKLTVTGVGVGTANIILRDATTGNVTIKVTVGSTADLFTSAPAVLTVGIGTSSPTFTIGGGSQVYTVTSGNTQIASVGINGNKFTINGVSAGKTTVIVKDSLGHNVTIDVTIGSGAAFYTTAPSDITLTANGTGTYIMGGGSAPYTATSSNTSVVTASASGNNLTLTGVGSGKAVVILRDAAGATLPINVTLGSGNANAVFTTAPSAVTIAVGASPAYQIGGGSAPYSISSSNIAIATATLTGSNFTITGVATGTANIIVKDAAGTPVTIVVSVGTGATVALYTSAPSTVTLAPGASPTYLVGGGTAPYAVTSSNTTVVTASIAGGTMTITGVAAGTATVRLVDSAGTPITFTVNVVSGTNTALSVAPLSISGYVGDVVNIRIDGGSAPYTITSSVPLTATVTSGSTLGAAGSISVLMARIGTANIIVTDAQGTVSSVGITVIAAPGGLTLSPAVWTINETNNSTIPLTISGGAVPYQVFTSNTVLSSVAGTSPDALNPLTFTGTTVNVSVGTQGTRCVVTDTPVTITVKDSRNVTTTSTMTIKDLNGGAGC
ncbi:beta strand repeat-containing protein [Undibacterium sp. Tian12W]|uniref:beta strand repeat-containing protein n=1 Tax=Undibacterium sp. Tian12W TaxID=3413054 RepID=UPI003BEFA891